MLRSDLELSRGQSPTLVESQSKGSSSSSNSKDASGAAGDCALVFALRSARGRQLLRVRVGEQTNGARLLAEIEHVLFDRQFELLKNED